MNDPQVFGRLLEDVEKPLYPGCMKYTKLSALVKLYNLKTHYDMLPLNNEMSLSMYEAKKTSSALGMEYQKIHACPNDCILYRNQYKDTITCPTCGKSRWKINNDGGKIKKGVPAKFMMISLLISGPRQPGKNIDVYLSPLVDDLKTLWEKGVETYDAHLHEIFTLKVILLWTINDFPAYGNLVDCTVKGYYACPICGEGTYSKRLKHGKTNDGLNARLDLVEMGLRPELFPIVDLKQTYLPPALHLIRKVQLCGPIYFRWMYPLERYMKVLKGYVRNHNLPEGCIVKCYLAKELKRLSITGKIFPTRLGGTMQIASSKDKNPVFSELCFYGVINEIWDLDYNMFRIPIFKCDWVDNKNGIKFDELEFTLVDFSKKGHKSDPFILASQAKQVFYVEDQLDPKCSISLSISPKDFNNMEGLDDFTDNCMEHHPFISSMPEVESFDAMDELEAIYMRKDYEGIWIENN
ncbi:hypothetical protein AAG906_005522 [Vitis piasezkii]